MLINYLGYGGVNIRGEKFGMCHRFNGVQKISTVIVTVHWDHDISCSTVHQHTNASSVSSNRERINYVQNKIPQFPELLVIDTFRSVNSDCQINCDPRPTA